jgi:para-nitrobenzyl esterase
MRAAWTNFAATGNPSTVVLHWPSVGSRSSVVSLVQPQPTVATDFSAIHHCAFWDAAQNP